MTPFESGDHTRHSAIWLMWWPRKFIVLIKMGKLVAAAGRQGGGPSQTWPQQRVLCQEFRKLSQTSLEIIHTISMSIDIDKKYKIDCIRLSYLFFLEFSKERLWTYVFLWRWATFFGESIFVENKERVCCPEQNAKSKSVLRLDFLMCGDEREGEEG